ncbi:MAG TPA: PEPxxWA-CTERM sorting domain-containing protein [Phenylobacterium sp.]
MLKQFALAAAAVVALTAGQASATTINLSTLIGSWDIQDQFDVLGNFYDNDYLADVAITAKFTDLYVWGDEYEVFVNGSSLGYALAPSPPAANNSNPDSAYNSGLFAHAALTLAQGDRLSFKAITVPQGYSDGTIAVSASSGAPEPATWAMMIVGVGMAGSVLSRRAALRLA